MKITTVKQDGDEYPIWYIEANHEEMGAVMTALIIVACAEFSPEVQARAHRLSTLVYAQNPRIRAAAIKGQRSEWKTRYSQVC